MKHAYLIIANKNPNQLQMLISMIDDKRNDIYLMIDKKSKDFPREFNTKYSKIFVLESINIYWGNFSQVQAEINLFKQAYKNGKYAYYHLMSGMDLPLATQDEIHNFFDLHPNMEFIKYTETLDLSFWDILKKKAYRIFHKDNDNFFAKHKIRRILEMRLKWHLTKNHQRSNNPVIRLFIKIENNVLLFLPQFKVNRSKVDIGSQWVSIDESLVSIIINNEDNIRRIFSSGILSDEIFIPTLVNLHPNIKERVYDLSPSHFEKDKLQGNLRYINWWDVPENSGSPYTWREKDFETLMKAKKMGHLFARKFDENIDVNIINKIYNSVIQSKGN